MRKITIFLTLLLSLSLISAISIYSGESVTIELSQPYDVYSIVGNTTEVMLDVVQNGTTVTITTNKYAQTDIYDIIFYAEDGTSIHTHSSGGGRGNSGTVTLVVENKTITEDNESEVIPQEEEQAEVIEEKEPETNFLTWLLLFIVIIIFIILLIFAYLKLKNTSERGS